MGMFGEDSYDDTSQQSDDLMQKQIEQDQAESERKRQTLFATRIRAVKSQGGQNWYPDRSLTGR